jgi:hypothetical protein
MCRRESETLKPILIDLESAVIEVEKYDEYKYYDPFFICIYFDAFNMAAPLIAPKTNDLWSDFCGQIF